MTSEELGTAASDMLKLIGAQHLGREVEERLNAPTPEAEDRRTLERVQCTLLEGVPDLQLRGDQAEGMLLELICRSRVALEALAELTAWRMDHPDAEAVEEGPV